MPRKKRIEWSQGTETFNEVYTRGLQYALVSDDNRQVNHFVFCKDFLHDMLFCKLNEESMSIYKFEYDPKVNVPLCSTKIRVMLGNTYDKDFGSKIQNALDLINQFEDAIKFERSKVFECEDPPEKFKVSGVCLFEGTRRWMMSPPMMSLYFLLLRVGMVHKEGEPFMQTIKSIISKKIRGYQTDDEGQLRRGLPGIERVLKESPTKIFYRVQKKNYPKNLATSTIHNRFGIVSFSEGTTHQYVPRWHKPKIEAKLPCNTIL